MELKGQNVMYYELEGGTTFIIRPSGTEPKVKVYIMAKGENKAEADSEGRGSDRCSEGNRKVTEATPQ